MIPSQENLKADSTRDRGESLSDLSSDRKYYCVHSFFQSQTDVSDLSDEIDDNKESNSRREETVSIQNLSHCCVNGIFSEDLHYACTDILYFGESSNSLLRSEKTRTLYYSPSDSSSPEFSDSIVLDSMSSRANNLISISSIESFYPDVNSSLLLNSEPKICDQNGPLSASESIKYLYQDFSDETPIKNNTWMVTKRESDIVSPVRYRRRQ